MPMTRDSWPARSRPVSGATASQPTNESISVAAARPTDSQPCGANGVQLAGRAAGAEPATAVTTTAISSATQAMIEAGPACWAARPGSSRSPGPNRAPMYSALARGTDSGRVRAGEVLIRQLSAKTGRIRWQRLRHNRFIAQYYAANRAIG